MDIFFNSYRRLFILVLGLLAMLNSCKPSVNTNGTLNEIENETVRQQQKFEDAVDISKIPNDTITTSNPDFSIQNGLFYYKDKKYSGILKKLHPRVNMTAYTSVYEGKRHGGYSSFYDSGAPFETKQYKNNRVTGRHLVYWRNGLLKAKYFYYDGKMEGTQKKWYADGSPYYVFNYKNGKREGKQQAWRTSGKLQINNEIINGRTYGLNRASLCFNLDNEKPELLGYAATTDKKIK